MDLPGTASLTCQRPAFSLPNGLHYLNGAYMSPLPRVVEEAGIQGIAEKKNPSLLATDDFFQESQKVRKAFAELVNIPDPNSVAIIPAVSYGIGVAARNTDLEAGQNVVLLHQQFPGNVYGWRRVASDRGAEIRMIHPGSGKGRGQRWNERILQAIDGDTGVVAMAPVHWTDGTVFDTSRVEGGVPATFSLGEVVPCFAEGVTRMKVGGKSTLICPPDLAYGDRGFPPRIPPGATLVFEIELLEIVAAAEAPETTTP